MIVFVYAYFSVLFYLPRTLYMDTSYMTFNLLNYETFALEHNRLSLFFLQFVPLIFVKLKMSLTMVLMSISLWPCFLYGSITYLLYKKFNQPVLAFVWLLLLIVPMRHFFNYALSESNMALGMSLLGFGYVIFMLESNRIPTLWNLTWLFGFNMIAVLFHPSAIIYLMIIGFVIFLKVGYNKWFGAHLLTYLEVCILYFLIKPKGGYDTQIIENIFSFQSLSNILDSYVINFYLGNFWSYYLLFFVAMLFILIRFFMQNKFMKLMLYSCFCLFVFIMVSIIYVNGDSVFFMEKNMLPISLIMLLPIVLVFKGFKFDKHWQHLITLSVMVLVFSFGLFQIHKVGLLYRSRSLQVLDIVKLMDSKGLKKVWIQQDAIQNSFNMAPWTMPYETLILSNLFLDKSITLKPFLEETNLKSEANDFIGSDFTPVINLDKNPLNPTYFKALKGNYQVIDITKE
ncbi:MAG: hypothetical protein Q8K70_10455 [Bacteroidota bacterium]|nr:hypothetical protein [Bacteroidota bacterium]